MAELPGNIILLENLDTDTGIYKNAGYGRWDANDDIEYEVGLSKSDVDEMVEGYQSEDRKSVV